MANRNSEQIKNLTPVGHAVIRCKHIRRFPIVPEELLKHRDNLGHSAVHQAGVIQILPCTRQRFYFFLIMPVVAPDMSLQSQWFPIGSHCK